jgi:hypothetical protein
MANYSQAVLAELPDIDEPISFADVTEFGELLDTPKTWRTSASQGHQGERAWDLGLGYENARKMLMEGWPAGAKKIQKLQAESGFELKAKPKTGRNVTGFAPCIGAAMSGDPRAMFTRPKRPMKAPVINLVFNGGANCNVNARCFENAGVAALSLINTLESQGVSVGLYAGYTVSGYGRDGTVLLRWEVPVKKPGQPLDLERLAFLIAHPAMFRRLGFAYMERSTKASEDALGSCYGYTTNHKPIVAQGHLMPELVNDHWQYDTVETAVKTVLTWWAEKVRTLNLEA